MLPAIAEAIVDKSPKASMISGRRRPCRPAKRGAERARLAETQAQSDISDGRRGLAEQDFGMLNPPHRVISVRRHTEGLPEGSREVERAQANNSCQQDERNWIGKVLLGIRNDHSLLPGSKSTSVLRLDTGLSVAETSDLMRQDGAEGLDIELVIGHAIPD
jgi:hypothetical protein